MTRREDDTIAYLAVARDFSSISEDTVVAHLGVVRDVRTLHEEVVVADDRLAPIVCGTVDDHILTDDVVVSDDTLALLAPELEILGQRPDYGTLMDFVVVADTRAIEDAREREDDAVVADDHIALDIGEGEYLAVVSDNGSWVDFGPWTYITWHILFRIKFVRGRASGTRPECYLPPPPRAL